MQRLISISLAFLEGRWDLCISTVWTRAHRPTKCVFKAVQGTTFNTVKTAAADMTKRNENVFQNVNRQPPFHLDKVLDFIPRFSIVVGTSAQACVSTLSHARGGHVIKLRLTSADKFDYRRLPTVTGWQHKVKRKTKSVTRAPWKRQGRRNLHVRIKRASDLNTRGIEMKSHGKLVD